MGHWFYDKYGDDIDGNRGVKLKCFELGPEDEEYIIEQIKLYIEENGYESFDELPEQITIHFIDPISEDDIDIEINKKDYREFFEKNR